MYPHASQTALLAFSLGLAAASSCAADLPRYRLEVGQELVYEGSSKFEHENGSHISGSKTTLWVTRKNDDGSWHIVARSETSFEQVLKGVNKPFPERLQAAMGEFDVHADGRVSNLPEDFDARGLAAVFYKLPATPEERQNGWTVKEKDGDEHIYRVAAQGSAKAGEIVFERTDKGIFSVIYVASQKELIHFEPARGLITKIESENSQGYGFNGKGAGLTELKSDTNKDAAWLTQLEQEIASLSGAKKQLREARDRIEKGASVDAEFGQMEKVLRSGAESSKMPLIAGQFNKQIESLEDSKRYLAEDKQKEAAVLDKPAAEWSTTDMDGKPHSLAGYKGKVVILDFWYRGCGWCVKAMPQIKEVVEAYRDKPVAILGMNTDRNGDDARFVIEKMSLNYPTLKAEGLPQKYSVQGFPTLVVIDTNGIVRKRHVGYSPTLKADLSKTIDELLKTSK